jgi:hypothetical protein
MRRLQRRLRLLQPEGHAHLAVHGRRRGQVPLRRYCIAAPVVEPAEPEMAVGGEGAHVEQLGQREASR